MSIEDADKYLLLALKRRRNSKEYKKQHKAHVERKERVREALDNAEEVIIREGRRTAFYDSPFV